MTAAAENTDTVRQLLAERVGERSVPLVHEIDRDGRRQLEIAVRASHVVKGLDRHGRFLQRCLPLGLVSPSAECSIAVRLGSILVNAIIPLCVGNPLGRVFEQQRPIIEHDPHLTEVYGRRDIWTCWRGVGGEPPTIWSCAQSGSRTHSVVLSIQERLRVLGDDWIVIEVNHRPASVQRFAVGPVNL